MHVSMEEHTFVTVNGLRVKIKMSYHLKHGNKHFIRSRFLEKPQLSMSTINVPTTTGITVDFNSLLTEMFRTSFRTSEVRCEVQKFTMKWTSMFVNKVSDWLHVRKQPIRILPLQTGL